jgi:DNA-binding transcriptional LysR family regulator
VDPSTGSGQAGAALETGGSSGIGAGVVPSLSLPLPSSSQLVSVPLTPRENRAIVLARRHDRSLSPAAEAAWQMIRRMALPAA